jgi:V-type H+-transporting ATPase subunit a
VRFLEQHLFAFQEFSSLLKIQKNLNKANEEGNEEGDVEEEEEEEKDIFKAQEHDLSEISSQPNSSFIEERKGSISKNLASLNDSLDVPFIQNNLLFDYISGVLDSQEAIAFARIIHRRTFGNVVVVLKNCPPQKGIDQQPLHKTVYMLIFKTGEILRKKLLTICDSFSKNRFQIVVQNVQQKWNTLKNLIGEAEELLFSTQLQIREMLKDTIQINLIPEFGGLKNLENDSEISALSLFSFFIKKEKHIYSLLSMMRFEEGMSFFRGLVWIPVKKHENLLSDLKSLGIERKIILPTLKLIEKHELVPPTYYELNEFTRPFQKIINMYGVPSHNELNPLFFVIITFPFLFAIMFGDICHGLIIAAFGN